MSSVDPNERDKFIPAIGGLRGGPRHRKGTHSPIQRVQKSPAPARITVQETIYHQVQQGQPSQITYGYNRTLTSDEQAYTRQLKVGLNWEPIDIGWIKGPQAAIVSIRNLEGLNLMAIPSPEELNVINGRILEVDFLGPAITEPTEDPAKRTMHSPPMKLETKVEPVARLLIPPREGIRVIPADISRMMIRCQTGMAKFTISIIPA